MAFGERSAPSTAANLFRYNQEDSDKVSGGHAVIALPFMLKGTTMQTRISLIFTFILCVLFGCQQKQRPDGLPDLFPCAITITQEEQPLDEALVRLVPENGGSAAWAVSGKTDAKGIARISTHADFSGAPEGTFKVLVSKTEMSPSQFPEPAKDASPEERVTWSNNISTEKRTKYTLVKPEFGDAKKTPHSITITKGKNEATFDVGEPIKEEIK